MPRTRRVFAVLLLTLLSLVVPWTIASDPGFPIPPLGALERGAYRAVDVETGKDLWSAEWVLEQETVAGDRVLHLRERGKGLRDGPVPIVWTERMRIALGGPRPGLTSSREAGDGTNPPWRVEERDFDYDRGTGRVVATNVLTGARESRTVRLTPRSIPTEFLSAVLRLLPDTDGGELRFEVVTRKGRSVPIGARIVGREWVEVPAGRFDCFKVRLELGGMSGIVAGLLMPTPFLWHTAAAPHFWVKYEGAADGPGTPTIVRELIRFEAQSPGGPVAPGERVARVPPVGKGG